MSVRRATALVAFTALYFVSGRLGLSLALINDSASAIWPPTGLAIAACLLLGRWVWPSILAGAFLVNVTITQAPVSSILIAAGNTAEALVAASIVSRFTASVHLFGKMSAIVTYLGAAALGAAVAATVGTAALVVTGLLSLPAASAVWLTWWTGDLSSALILTPAIVTCVRAGEGSLSPGRVFEALPLAAAVLFSGYIVFGPTPSGVRSYPIMFVTLPALLWAALRFGLPGATLAIVVTAAVARIGTRNGLGPFVRSMPNESLLLLQAYLCVKMFVMLTLAAEVEARRRAERDLRELNTDLERRITARWVDLQRAHGRLVEAQHVAHIGSWEWDIAANSIWWSDEMYRLFGLPVGSPISYERYISMIHPEDRGKVQAIVAESARTGDAFSFEHRALRSDGTVVTILARGRVAIDATGRAIRMLGIGHDITERKRAEEERLELAREQMARREAEDSNRMKDEFLATLSHELRTPINALIGWAQMLKRIDGDAATRDKAIDAIQRNATIQAQLVSDILDVARIRSGTLSIDAHPVPLRTVVDGAVDIMRPVIADKRIAVTVDVPDDLVVSGDVRRLQQVCWNMLSNAAKFLEPHGSIAIAARKHGDTVTLTIEDDGPGIPEDFLPYAFDQFRQADASPTRQHGGLGLGLAISRDLVTLHGGTIAAANRPQGGAVFTIMLPVEPSA